MSVLKAIGRSQKDPQASCSSESRRMKDATIREVARHSRAAGRKGLPDQPLPARPVPLCV
jgi:hypothetical protein